jgi:hypothetical protein
VAHVLQVKKPTSKRKLSIGQSKLLVVQTSSKQPYHYEEAPKKLIISRQVFSKISNPEKKVQFLNPVSVSQELLQPQSSSKFINSLSINNNNQISNVSLRRKNSAVELPSNSGTSEVTPAFEYQCQTRLKRDLS